MRRYTIPSPIIDTAQLSNINRKINILSFSEHDLSLALDFLKQYDGNKSTFESYRREIERILQWAWLVSKKSILELKRQDIKNYIEFCLKPPKSWIGIKRVPRFIERGGIKTANIKWRPFVATVSKQAFKNGEKPDKNKYQLSQKSIREIFTVLSSFYNYLALEEKISINPVLLIKQKNRYLQKQQTQKSVMRLTENQWQYCLNIVKEMAVENPEKHERTLFIISALYLLYLRISELVETDRWTPLMKHFHQDSNGSWWFKIIGKGNKMRDIAVSDDMLSTLKHYRVQMGLTPLPSPNEKIPLLSKDKGKGAMTDSRHIRRLIQYCFDKVVNKLREDKFSSDADALESATVHWLRHTGISDDINKRGRPIAHVRDDAGHSSSATTDRYNDIELKERHKSAKQKKLIR
jgi:site-specific recombinase XerD